MNQKDYKAIAKIIKKDIWNLILSGVSQYCAEQVINDLADYFEKEDIKNIRGTVPYGTPDYKKIFNKQQFLKDCGVKYGNITSRN